jgi:hypothetical protein
LRFQWKRGGDDVDVPAAAAAVAAALPGRRL